MGGNTFLGYSAGSGTNTGGGNVFTGTNACRSNTAGQYNAVYGFQGGYNTSSSTDGSNNTYLGTGAGNSFNIIHGSNNIFIGRSAGASEPSDVNNSIEIGNTGSNPYGSASIQIGTLGTQINQTYIQGISNSGHALTRW